MPACVMLHRFFAYQIEYNMSREVPCNRHLVKGRKGLSYRSPAAFFVSQRSRWRLKKDYQEQSEASDSVDIYPRDYSGCFAPQTALDLFSRVPGFTLGAGADLRGFGGGAANLSS